MRHLNWILATSLVALTFSGPSVFACEAIPPLDLKGIKRADVVVLGHVFNYTPIFDPVAAYHQTDHAEFDVEIDQVVVGRAPETIHVSWRTPMIAVPTTMPSGSYLIALHYSSEPETFSVVIQVCSGSFIFPNPSEGAQEALEILRS
jgi:hypothetical protein